MIYYNKLKKLLLLVKKYSENKEELIKKINKNDFFNYNIRTEDDDNFYRDLLKNDITLLKDYLYNTNTTIDPEVFLYQLKLFDDEKDTIPSYTRPEKDKKKPVDDKQPKSSLPEKSDDKKDVIKYNDISRKILLLLLNMYLKNKKNLLFEKEIIDKFSKISYVPNEKIPISIMDNNDLKFLFIQYLQNKKLKITNENKEYDIKKVKSVANEEINIDKDDKELFKLLFVQYLKNKNLKITDENKEYNIKKVESVVNEIIKLDRDDKKLFKLLLSEYFKNKKIKIDKKSKLSDKIKKIISTVDEPITIDSNTKIFKLLLLEYFKNKKLDISQKRNTITGFKKINHIIEDKILLNNNDEEIFKLLLLKYFKNKKLDISQKTNIITNFKKVVPILGEKIQIDKNDEKIFKLLLLKYFKNKKIEIGEIKDIEKKIKEIKIKLDKVNIEKNFSKKSLLEILDFYLKNLKINEKKKPNDNIMVNKKGGAPEDYSTLFEKYFTNGTCGEQENNSSFYCILKKAVEYSNSDNLEEKLEKLKKADKTSLKNEKPFEDLKIRSRLFNKAQYLKLFSILSLLFENKDNIDNIRKKYPNVHNNIIVNTHRLFTKLDKDCYELLKKTFGETKKLKNYRLVDVFGNVVKILDFDKIIDRDTKYGNFFKNGETQNTKGEKYILTYTLMNILHYEHEEIFKNIRGGESGLVDVQVFAKIYDLCWNSYNHCCAINLKLLDNYVDLEKIFNELKKTNKNIYTFLRIRHDPYDGEFPSYNHKFGFTYEPTYNSNPSNFPAFNSISMLSNSQKLGSSTKIDRIVNDSEFNITYYNRDFIIDAKLFGINNFETSKRIRLVNEANDLRNMQSLYDKNYSLESNEEKKTSKYERYIFGPFDSIYDHEISLEEITKTDKKMINLKEKLKSGESVCFVGNGQSGTGKTSFLLGYFTDKLNRGLVDFLIEMKDIVEVRIGEVYLNKNKTPTTEIKIIDGKTLEGLASGDMNPGWVLFQLLGDELKTQKEGKYSSLKIERKVRSTTNNKVSSRSHAVIDIVLKSNAHLIICDLAGVENTFQCNSLKVQFGFFKKLDEEYTKRKEKKNKENEDNTYNFTDFLNQIYWKNSGFDLPETNDYDEIKKWTDEKVYNKIDNDRKIKRNFNKISEYEKKAKIYIEENKRLNLEIAKRRKSIEEINTSITNILFSQDQRIKDKKKKNFKKQRRTENQKIKLLKKIIKENKQKDGYIEYELLKEFDNIQKNTLFTNIKKACEFSSLEGQYVINEELRKIVRDISKYALFTSKNSLYNGSELNSFCNDQDISSHKLELFYNDDVKAQDNTNTKYWSGKIFDLIYMNDVKIMEWKESKFVEAKDYNNNYSIRKINFATVTVIDGRNYDFGGNFRNNGITGKLNPYFSTKIFILKDYNSSKGDQLKEDIIDGINKFDNIYLLRYYKNIFNPGEEDDINKIYNDFINDQNNNSISDTKLKKKIDNIKKQKLKIEPEKVKMNGIEMLRIIENTNALTLMGTLQTMTLTQSADLGHTCSRYHKTHRKIPPQICYNEKKFGYGKKYIKYKKKYLKYKNIPYKNISLNTNNTNYFNKYIKYKKKYYDLKYKYI